MISNKKLDSQAIRFCVQEDGQEVGRAFLYLIRNDLNEQPYGLLEDVYVSEDFRGKGHAKELINQVLKTAKQENCYKLIATSRYARPKVHELYQNLGFVDHGKEFRLDFPNENI